MSGEERGGGRRTAPSKLVTRHVERFRERVGKWKDEKLRKYTNDAKIRDKYPQRATYEKKIDELARKKFEDGRSKIVRAAAARASANARGGHIKKMEDESNSETTKPRVLPPDSVWPFKCMGLRSSFSDCVTGDAASKESTLPVKWNSLFADPRRDLFVDIGSGQGRFLMRFAFECRRRQDSEKSIDRTSSSSSSSICRRRGSRVKGQPRNFLGVELRKGLVDSSTSFATSLGLHRSCRFLHAKVDGHFVRELLKSYPGQVKLICFQLPDPRLEKNMRRGGAKLLTSKRVMDAELCKAISGVLSPGGMVYVSSDYELVFEEMCSLLSGTELLVEASQAKFDSLRILEAPEVLSKGTDCGNPTGIPTERELFLHQKSPSRVIYRRVYEKKATPGREKHTDRGSDSPVAVHGRK